MLGMIEGRREEGWLDGITKAMDMLEQSLGAGEEQGGLVCCNPWSHKELDMTG